jgi:ABC-type glycerol-3-phosphate transport system substrate-binding protein
LWGVFPDHKIAPIISQFNTEAKDYRVQYEYVSEEKFNQKLLEALASGTGPDMILAPYQIILSQRERIAPFPITSVPEKIFKDTFVDGASLFFTPNGALAFPVTIDPMVLFYNRQMLSKHGIVNPPQYWDEVASLTETLTIRQKAQFIESSIALGSPMSLYTKDILMAIVGQLGQTPVIVSYRPDGTITHTIYANTPTTEDVNSVVYPLASAARFVTQFSDPALPTYTWNDSLGRADDRFVAEKLAMYIGYYGEYASLRERNPRGEFEMTYLPQTRGYTTFVTGMRMYGIATLKTTRNPQVSFTVQSQLSGGGISQNISAVAGGVSAIRQYATTQGIDPVIAKSMLVARGWSDSHQEESTSFISAMVSDIINRRYGVNDAVEMFVSRLRDVYFNKKY